MIKRSYPTFFYKADKDEMQEVITVWWDYFKEYPFDLMQRAFKQYALSDKSGFAPAVGQLNALVVEMLNPQSEEISAEKAWEMGMGCIKDRNWSEDPKAVFERLPDEVKNAFGSCSNLRNIGYMDASQVPYEKDRFIKLYKENQKRRREDLKDPKAAVQAYVRRKQQKRIEEPGADDHRSEEDKQIRDQLNNFVRRMNATRTTAATPIVDKVLGTKIKDVEVTE